MILILNGPNLNLLGSREPRHYGRATLEELEESCRGWGADLGVDVLCRQSNHEGVLLDWLHAAEAEGAEGVVLNAGAYTHTSVALRDAVAAIAPPVVEVHLSNVHARESFRHTSLLAPVCAGSVVGLGVDGYRLALDHLARRLQGIREPSERI